ncbi:hypothetical protein [Oceanicola sp. 22II-s10i]|nr:hypothetical protein [Oceanicola sp. 22II-s10i]
MDLNRIINMVINQVIRRIVGKGVNAGFDRMSGKGRKQPKQRQHDDY